MRVGEALDHVDPPLADVPVLVADTGLDLDHPDLASRVLSPVPAGADFIGNELSIRPTGTHPDDDPNHPPGCSDHGTLVAGLLGAAWNNGFGGAGVAPNAIFIPFRTCWDDDQCYESMQAPAMNRAIDDYGARVVSMSWLSAAHRARFQEDDPIASEHALRRDPIGQRWRNGRRVGADQRMPCGLDAPNILCVSTSSPGRWT